MHRLLIHREREEKRVNVYARLIEYLKMQLLCYKKTPITLFS